MSLFQRPEELPHSDELQRVLAGAGTEALNLSHQYIGTEHVLLALVSNHDSAAAAALARIGISEEKVRSTMGDTVRRGRMTNLAIELPLTTRTKTALARASHAARELGHPEVTPVHLLVGFMREGINIAAQVLQHHGFTLEQAEDIARGVIE